MQNGVQEAAAEWAYDPAYGLPVIQAHGLAWAMPTTRALLDNIRRFPLEASDVFVAAFPKSGTNWMQIMLANLYDDWGTCAITPHRRVPSIDYPTVITPDGTMEGYEKCIAAVPPRLMKTHLPARLMPDAWLHRRAKVIYLTRNPKDVCVSFYHQLKNAGVGFDVDFERWVRRFVEGRTIFGGWLDHVLGWRRLNESDGVLHLTYEALRANPVGEMRRVVRFLGKPVTEARFAGIVEAARFENMRSSGLAVQINAGGSSGKLMRDGSVGGWMKHLSPSQSALFDVQILPALTQAGLELPYA